MKHCCSFLVIILLPFPVLCQMVAPASTIPGKPPIDSAAIANWADLLWSEPVISDDGKYFMYPIDNLPVGSSTLVVQQTEGTWKKEFIGAERGFFSGDSKQAIFKKNDSLYILPLGKEKPIIIKGVSGHKKPSGGTGQWLAYQLKNENRELVLYDLFTNKNQQFKNVLEYQFANNGKVLLVKTKIRKSNTNCETIEWINLEYNKRCTVWSSADNQLSANFFQFDEKAQQLAFIVEDKINNQIRNSIWYYKEGMYRAVMKISEQSSYFDSNMVVSKKAPYFSFKGKYIFFKIQSKPEPSSNPNPDAIKVDVWSHKDVILQYRQLLTSQNVSVPTEELIAIIPTTDNNLKIIGKKGFSNHIPCEFNDLILVKEQKYSGDKTWLSSLPVYYVLSLIDDSKKILVNSEITNITSSNDGNYLIFFDIKNQNYFSYNLISGNLLNITKFISERLTNIEMDEWNQIRAYPVGIGGWINNKSLLVYDNYDVWQVDITGNDPPENLTKGFGKSNNIKFRVIKETIKKPNISSCNSFILSAFHVGTKYNGFFEIDVNKKDFKLLHLGPYNYYTNGSDGGRLINMKPLKAAKKSAWIVKRQTASDAPNFFFTDNFKTFRQLTNIQPQKAYNWFTTELMTWKQPNGITCQGILYKPSYFDQKKRYPVIVNYYEKRSQNLYQFLSPNFMSGDLNIPWFVSRDYIVFTPDINYTIGKIGESVLNSVLTGVKQLFKLPFVDSTKIGIQGHSLGGYETNYLVSHSNVFAAAAEGAGGANFISYYGTPVKNELLNSATHFENGGSYRMESTLWEHKDLYISNSPIFYAEKVTTPLLIMHNKNDQTVPWQQAIEFFIALRRGDKKVWLLQYDNGKHGVSEKDAIDYTTRVSQFFDHYLKNAPAPYWMMTGGTLPTGK